MILEKTIKIVPYTRLKYLRELGYNPIYGQEMEIKVEDLPHRSQYRITAICDEEGCNNQKEISYASYCLTVEKNGFYRCFECGNKAKKQTFLDKFGVDNPMKVDSIKQKVANTTLVRHGYRCIFEADNYQEIKKEACLRKFGVEHQLQSPEIQDKVKQTNLKRYGVEQVLQSEKIQQKIRETNLERYGVQNSMLSSEILEKRNQTNIQRYGGISPTNDPIVYAKQKATNIKKYGVENPFESSEIQCKIKETLYRNNSQYVSIPQEYICNLYNGQLNYPILMYNADILVDNIDIEYDGGGHSLQVKYGTISEEDFKHREIIRGIRIKKAGYKAMHIISYKDLLPSDEILLQMLADTKQYFINYPNHSWVEYYIDEGVMKNAENKNGISYDYGELRKIKKDIINKKNKLFT